MRAKYALVAVALLVILCLAGCSSRNEPQNSGTPTPGNSVSPTPSVSPSTHPENDAMEGGGAGGTNDPDAGVGSSPMPTTSGNGGILDDAGNAVDDIMDGAGDAVNDMMDGVGNAMRGNRN